MPAADGVPGRKRGFAGRMCGMVCSAVPSSISTSDVGKSRAGGEDILRLSLYVYDKK